MRSDDRPKLETQLDKLYGLALDMCNASSHVRLAATGESECNLSNSEFGVAVDDAKDSAEDRPHDAAWYSGEFRKYLQG